MLLVSSVLLLSPLLFDGVLLLLEDDGNVMSQTRASAPCEISVPYLVSSTGGVGPWHIFVMVGEAIDDVGGDDPHSWRERRIGI